MNSLPEALAAYGSSLRRRVGLALAVALVGAVVVTQGGPSRGVQTVYLLVTLVIVVGVLIQALRVAANAPRQASGALGAATTLLVVAVLMYGVLFLVTAFLPGLRTSMGAPWDAVVPLLFELGSFALVRGARSDVARPDAVADRNAVSPAPVTQALSGKAVVAGGLVLTGLAIVLIAALMAFARR